MAPRHLNEVLNIEGVSFPTPWSREAFLSEIIDNAYAHYFVGLIEDKVVGYAGLWVVLEDAHVTTIAVHPGFRGCKMGHRLLNRLMSVAVQRGADKITLEVRTSNKIARELYSKVGFVPVGIRKKYYTDNSEDAIIMFKQLPLSGAKGLR